MTKPKFKTGVRTLSGNKLKPFYKSWMEAKPKRTPHSLYVAMHGVEGGKAIVGSKLEEIACGGMNCGQISDESRYALCVVLGVTWEEISEPLD